MDALESIFSRRSIRRYTGGPIGRDKLLLLAKAGMAAPTSRDTRHFYFIIVDEEKQVLKLAEGLPYAKMLFTAKHAIIVASNVDEAHGGMETGYWIQDASAAAQNILLAACSFGLGACWTAAHPRPERVAFVKQVLSLPENVYPLCVIAVGIPSGEEKPRDKFDASHVFWNQWDHLK